jgi:hypothetical protein
MNLLPLAPEPFMAPTDRDMLPSERREFVRTHRTCIFGYGRRNDGPAMSVVYYIPTDSDELLVSTMRDRAKAKAVGRSAKVSLCILDERWPFAYLQVYCDAEVDDDQRSRKRLGPPSRRWQGPRIGSPCAAGPTRPSPSLRVISIATIRRRRSAIGSRPACPGTLATKDLPEASGPPEGCRRHGVAHEVEILPLVGRALRDVYSSPNPEPRSWTS